MASPDSSQNITLDPFSLYIYIPLSIWLYYSFQNFKYLLTILLNIIFENVYKLALEEIKVTEVPDIIDYLIRLGLIPVISFTIVRYVKWFYIIPVLVGIFALIFFYSDTTPEIVQDNRTYKV